MGSDAWKSIRPSAKSGLELLDPDVVLDQLLPQLETDVDAILLLSHAGVENDRQLAAKHTQKKKSLKFLHAISTSCNLSSRHQR